MSDERIRGDWRTREDAIDVEGRPSRVLPRAGCVSLSFYDTWNNDLTMFDLEPDEVDRLIADLEAAKRGA